MLDNVCLNQSKPGVVSPNDTQMNGDGPVIQVHFNEGRQEFCISPHIPITTRPSHFILYDGGTEKFIECQVYDTYGDRHRIRFDHKAVYVFGFTKYAKNVSDVIEVGSTNFSSAVRDRMVATIRSRVVKGGRTLTQPYVSAYQRRCYWRSSALTDVSRWESE